MSDEFIKKVSVIILYAKSEGLEIWLEAKPTEPPEVGMLSSWLEYDGGTVKQCCSPERSPFDYTNSAVLIDSVLERYKSGLSKEAYGYLAGFTSEVPDFSGMMSWKPSILKNLTAIYFQILNLFLKTMKKRQSLKRGIGKK